MTKNDVLVDECIFEISKIRQRVSDFHSAFKDYIDHNEFQVENTRIESLIYSSKDLITSLQKMIDVLQTG